ncbi:MAG: type II toxin-antitoxin system HicA family toxin [Candidatus Paceibacterales bacterium]
MPKKPRGKPRLIPEKPKEVIKKLEKNGFRCVNRRGGDWYFLKRKGNKDLVVCVSVHPKELGKPFIKNIIRTSKKTNEEWLNL